jgi:hypothetical protein
MAIINGAIRSKHHLQRVLSNFHAKFAAETVADTSPHCGWRMEHVGAMANPKGHDKMFLSIVRAIVDTSDSVGGPDGDYLIRPHLISLYETAITMLDYLDKIGGQTAWRLLEELACADGFESLDNLKGID